MPPWQFLEKLISVILKAVAGGPISLCGDGTNVRDRLYVEDHVEAQLLEATCDRLGKSYSVGAPGGRGRSSERTNRGLLQTIRALTDQLLPEGAPHAHLITRVSDSPGYDRQYAIDAGMMTVELGWKPRHSFEQGLKAMARWYFDHIEWCQQVCDRNSDCGDRIGVTNAPAA